MIRSLEDLVHHVRADLGRYDFDQRRLPSLASGLLREPQARWLIRLRVTEYVHNTVRSPAGRVADAFLRWRLQRSAIKLGYTIPINRFGPGLKLPHWGTIVVSGAATIGANCTLHPSTLIGWKDGAPRIGDDVYIGNGAKLIGPVAVGDGAIIAPGAVVNRDVAPSAVVGGIPARPLHSREAAVAPDLR
jgi:serine O-acetyltransferase